jgi:DNA polymerase epsilon subunit 1
MRENSFYVDTVRAFRDRRYDFKRKVKEQKGLKEAAIKKKDFIQADEH